MEINQIGSPDKNEDIFQKFLLSNLLNYWWKLVAMPWLEQGTPSLWVWWGFH